MSLKIVANPRWKESVGLLAILLFGGEMALPARNLDLPEIILPAQNYAVLDLSGAVQGNNAVDLIALNNDGRVSFKFTNGSTEDVYKWENGLLGGPDKTPNTYTGQDPVSHELLDGIRVSEF